MWKQSKGVASILPEFHGETDDWTVYREILEEFYTAQGISGADRVPVLISVIGKQTYGTLRSLCHPESPKDMDYEALCRVLARQFIPEIAIFQRRARFYRAEQRSGESVKEWYARLKTLSMECQFEEHQLEPVLLDRFVIGLVPGPVRSRLYEENPENLKDLGKTVDLAAAKEATVAQEREGEQMAQEFAELLIGDGMRHGRHRRHGKHSHRFGGPWMEGHGRHGHHRHGRHRHHHSEHEGGHEHPQPFGRHGHGPHMDLDREHPHPVGRHGHHGPRFGPPAFGGPGIWGGGHHHRREMAIRHCAPWWAERKARGHPFALAGCPGMMEGFGRHGRPCGKWGKRHHHRRSSSSSSSSSSDSNSDGSSSSGTSSESDTPNEQKVEQQEKKCRKMCQGVGGKQHGKRHGGKRDGHGRHHRYHHHGHHPHGRSGCRRERKHPEDPVAPEHVDQPTEPSTEPELIE